LLHVLKEEHKLRIFKHSGAQCGMYVPKKDNRDWGKLRDKEPS